MVGRLYNLSAQVARQRAAEVLERISLAADADRLVRTYSGGMKRRLDLAASLVGRPDVLFLDEPTTGIDPRSRVDVWALIRDLVSSGTTVLLTTQYLDEADQLADRIGVIHEGRLISEGTGNELKDRLGGAVIQVEVPEAAQAATRAALGADDGTDGTITLPAPAGIDPTVVIVRRNLLRILRLPQLLVFATVQPVMFLILFNYVFGGSVGRAIPAAAGGKYINWLVIDRFRSLPMARSAVLAGRTVADLLRNGFVIGLMIVLGFVLGFRPQTSFVSLVGGVLVAMAFAFALSWGMASLGLAVKNSEAAQTASFLPVFRWCSPAPCSCRPARCRTGCACLPTTSR